MTAISTSPVADVRIDVLGVAAQDAAARAQHVLGAQAVRGGVRLRLLGVEDELDDPGAVAQVDEDDAAVVATTMHPAGDPHLAVNLGGRRRHRTSGRGSGSRGAGASQDPAPAQQGVHDGVVLERLLVAASRSRNCVCVSPTVATYRAPRRFACLACALGERPCELELRGEPGQARLAHDREGRHARLAARPVGLGGGDVQVDDR